MIDFDAFDALTFDCYGTLINWELGIVSALRPWIDRDRPGVTDAQLLTAFAKAEPIVEHAHPTAIYSEILRLVHGEIAVALDAESTEADAQAFGASVPDWPAFPDTTAALQELRQRYKLVILSNVDRESFAGSQQRLGVPFDAVVTAELVGAYKPDRAMFEASWRACDALGVPKDRILHVAQSLYHDHVPAKALGMTTVHVNRPPLAEGTSAVQSPGDEVRPDLTVTTMAELAGLACNNA